MENFTTQEHQRSNQGNVVVENPGKTIAKMREDQKNRNIVSGIIISAMALTVVLTGTMLGATTAHNNKLKTQIRNMEMQNTTTMSQRLDDTEQKQSDITVTDDLNPTNPTRTVNTLSDTNNSASRTRSWERTTGSTTIDNLARPYTGRKYYSQYYQPKTAPTEYISQEKAEPVALPAITVNAAPTDRAPHSPYKA